MDEFTIVFGFSLIAINLGMNLYTLINLDKVKKLIKYKVPDSNRILPVKIKNNNLKQEVNEQKINKEINEEKEEINSDNVDIEMGIIVNDDVNTEGVVKKRNI